MRRLCSSLIGLVFLTASVSAAVFQYSVPVATSRGDRSAFLWIPSGAKQVCGVVIGGMTLMEREFAKDRCIRKACADQQVGMTPRGFTGLKKGMERRIAFPPLGNLNVEGGPVALKATSDSGLPVEYYVAYGPAIVADGKLRIAELPARATFPITVKVVACQFGSGVEPMVKTATPVEQTIQICKPQVRPSIATPAYCWRGCRSKARWLASFRRDHSRLLAHRCFAAPDEKSTQFLLDSAENRQFSLHLLSFAV